MAKVYRETLANVTNGADDTYYYYFQPGGQSLVDLMGVLSGGSGTCTVTLEATLDDVAAYADVTHWFDVTSVAMGAATFTASFLKAMYQIMAGYTWCRVKVVASTGDADDADWMIALGMVDFSA